MNSEPVNILLLSDTHSYLNDAILKHCAAADEIWHAGDIGSVQVADTLEDLKPFRAVYGNIDGQEIRRRYPEHLFFNCEGVKVLMIHIGGYPGKYPEKVKNLIRTHQPDLFICGHSHILKVIRDQQFNKMLCVNPGAAGKQGFQQMRTMVKMELGNGKIQSLDVIELGPK